MVFCCIWMNKKWFYYCFFLWKWCFRIFVVVPPYKCLKAEAVKVPSHPKKLLILLVLYKNCAYLCAICNKIYNHKNVLIIAVFLSQIRPYKCRNFRAFSHFFYIYGKKSDIQASDHIFVANKLLKTFLRQGKNSALKYYVWSNLTVNVQVCKHTNILYYKYTYIHTHLYTSTRTCVQITGCLLLCY